MFTDNRTTYLRRSVMVEVARIYFEDKLLEEVDRIPRNMIQRNAVPNRCCIEKDREIIRQRVISALGFGLEDEEEIDIKLLSDFAKESLTRTKIESPILTFIAEGCNACVRVNYYVTEVCHNCVAKPCIVNCPRGAISSDERKANIAPKKCVNCGLCMKVCPYHAIVYVPVPCEESCPTGAISKDENGKESIDYTKCIFCGKCIKACPFGAITEKSQIIDVITALKADNAVALLAPAIIGQFPGTLEQILGAVKLLGFSHVVEVAKGADITVETEATELQERLEKGDHVMGTSCCPAYIEAVKKHAKNFEKFVSHAKTPMAYTAEIARKEYPGKKIVFIGPCVAKRHEGLSNSDVDFVLTFEELGALFIGKKIDTASCSEGSFDIKSERAESKNFPVSQGVAGAVKKCLEDSGSTFELKAAYINGLSKKTIKLLDIYANKCPGNLLEIMSCEGGCIGGPGVVSNPSVSRKKLEQYTGIIVPQDTKKS
jgi:[FeFe] hydrogenase (group B1/B3)